MSLREEFVHLARAEGANVRAVCRRVGISPKTGYKWLGRFAAAGRAGLAEQSRRPQRSPHQTAATVEAQVMAARQASPRGPPVWGRWGEAAPLSA